LEQVFKALIQALKKAKIPYMIVGGLAANYHGMPRATFDIDLVVQIDADEAGTVVTCLERLHFSIRKKDAEQMVRIGNRIMAMSPDHPYRVDLWLIKSEHDRTAFARRSKGRLFGQSVWFISKEDLILSKLKAGRAKDLEDAEGVLKVQGTSLNWQYLDDWAARLNVTDELKRLKN
jgi:hypothetical protein